MEIDTNYSDIYSKMAGSLTKLYYFLQRSQLQSLRKCIGGNKHMLLSI
jgi:hypothetical protein